MEILTVVGNRPQFIKAAAVSGLLREHHDERLIHTGQHHDERLSGVFFDELALAAPDRELGIAGGSNTSQTARMLAALEGEIVAASPGAVLVYGDTNSTLAGALAGAQAGCPVIHLEAGMRSFDMDMPEELNRVVVDRLSSLLLCPSASAAANLRAERTWGAVEVVGDVMVDLAMRWQPAVQAGGGALAARALQAGGYLLLTAHRAGNVDPPERLASLVALVGRVAEQGGRGPIVFPVHPRTRARLEEQALLGELSAMEGVHVCDPLPYGELAELLSNARAVLTDSGGMQKEAYVAGVPCITLRDRTEWMETVEAGWNTLVDLDAEAALSALEREVPGDRPALYGSGDAAERCVAAIDAFARERAPAGAAAGGTGGS
ncbi:MAG: UDP-N-acetylglucosamine 2-epimerase (non-hydrolyzing) [Acidobacteriota bacterium]|nr:UDP-N-acetylglucosamine 2-epimerase (non-hydrolyzing) [Acidobacteriota bacterium]